VYLKPLLLEKNVMLTEKQYNLIAGVGIGGVLPVFIGIILLVLFFVEGETLVKPTRYITRRSRQ
jgi:hypothetical protein